jgi:glycolate oxidase
MALPGDVYRELEDILGAKNISENPAVLDAYAYFGAFMLTPSPKPEDRYLLKPEAVVLPGSTEDVQAIIKLCSRRGIKFRASSTGYGPWNAASNEGEILLDLRRMNRILEIDEKNMYIVVEPYVSFAQVQAEAHKRGLTCHVVGAGSTCSFLASHTSVDGNNAQGISQGYSGRNMLVFEWVLPTGEILKSGSFGSGAGWFSGDGPGPSLRGITRGIAGSRGGIGVFTKCSCHLHPWPGPREMEIKGISPYYETEVPPLFEYHVIGWPTWEQCADALYKIGEASIIYALQLTGGPGSHGATVTGSNNEYYEKWEELKELPEISFAIVLVANSPEEHEYQVKVLDKILAETGGKILPIGEKPIFKKRDIINMIKGCFVPRTAFRCTGTFTVDGMVGTDTVDHAAMALKIDGPHRDKYAGKGVIMDDGTYNSWGCTYEGAHSALFECGHLYGGTDEESCRSMSQMIEEGMEITLKTPLALNWMAAGPFLTVFGPACGNFQNWMRKIKQSFDPNDAADPSWYISGKVE